MRLVLFVLALTIAAGASAQQNEDIDAAATKICAAVRNIVPPTVPPSSQDDKDWLAGCQPDDLYDHAANPAQLEAARRCALSEWNNESHPASNREYDPGLATLVAIYVNGDGVTRNVDLAIHFLCQNRPSSDPDATLSSFIIELDKSKSSPVPPRYNFCNLPLEIENKSIEYECAQNEHVDQQSKRLAHIAQVSSTWTVAQKSALSAVLEAENAYAQASADAEAVTGTGVGYSMLEAEDDVDKEFVTDIDRLNQGELPSFTHEDYLNADKELNSRYRKLLAGLDQAQATYGAAATVPSSNVRTAERAWLIYRDVFVHFARLRWPNVSTDSWLTFLTRERIERFLRVSVD